MLSLIKQHSIEQRKSLLKPSIQISKASDYKLLNKNVLRRSSQAYNLKISAIH